jgi:hypothetical protein
MCFTIQLAFSSTTGFWDLLPWSPWARVHPAIPARTMTLLERRIFYCSDTTCLSRCCLIVLGFIR